MRLFLKVIIFIILLITSLFFLLKSGLWFYQDSAWWSKNLVEAAAFISDQLHVFSGAYGGYYYGYDKGILSFTSIVPALLSYLLIFLFGTVVGQIIFIGLGFVLLFVSFYFFSSLFIKNKDVCYVLSLLYTFNPLSYVLLGHSFYNFTAPLFIYSFYKYFLSKRLEYKYLLLNIVAIYFGAAYIRLVEINAIVILPYTIYFLIQHKKMLQIRKIIVLVITYILMLLPFIYSTISQFTQHNQTAFYYGSVLNTFSPLVNFWDAFNLFHTINITLYANPFWTIAGILFIFIAFSFLLVYPRKKWSWFLFINIALFLFGITCFGLPNLFPNGLYHILLSFLPFITNGFFWAFFITPIPLLMILGIVMQERPRFLFLYSFLFIFLSILPLLSSSNAQLKKLQLSDIPASYQQYFIQPYKGISEATQYIPNLCWNAQFMQNLKLPLQCFNFGLHYNPIAFANPRLLSGEDYFLSKDILGQTSLNNLRVTHNLKDIIVAKDIPKSNQNSSDFKKAHNALSRLALNPLLKVNVNQNFNQYSFKNKDNYEFYIYSPKTVVYKNNVNDIFDNSLQIKEVPVVINNNALRLETSYQQAKISYKIDPLNPTKYYVKISDVDISKPFLLQMNQSFNNNWKIVWIDKNYFNTQACTSQWNNFSITNNTYCQYNDSFINLSDAQVLTHLTVNSTNHFMGNFIGNGWIIQPSDIPQSQKNNHSLYLILIYQKQIFYVWTVAIAGIMFIILVALTLFQNIWKRFSVSRKHLV